MPKLVCSYTKNQLKLNLKCCSSHSTGSPQPKATLRFPWAAGELPTCYALRDLTVAFPPTGVSGGLGLLPAKLYN